MTWKRVGSWVAASGVVIGPALLMLAWHQRSEEKRAEAAAWAILPAAKRYRRAHPKECPTPAALRDAKIVTADSTLEDPWGAPYGFVCEGSALTVRSLGRDGVASTDDDIVVSFNEPPPFEQVHVVDKEGDALRAACKDPRVEVPDLGRFRRECRDRATAMTPTPSTVELPGFFDGDSWPVRLGCAYRYKSWIDARNVFNAPIRRHYICTLNPMTGDVNLRFDPL